MPDCRGEVSEGVESKMEGREQWMQVIFEAVRVRVRDQVDENVLLC